MHICRLFRLFNSLSYLLCNLFKHLVYLTLIELVVNKYNRIYINEVVRRLNYLTLVSLWFVTGDWVLEIAIVVNKYNRIYINEVVCSYSHKYTVIINRACPLCAVVFLVGHLALSGLCRHAQKSWL